MLYPRRNLSPNTQYFCDAMEHQRPGAINLAQAVHADPQGTRGATLLRLITKSLQLTNVGLFHHPVLTNDADFVLKKNVSE